MNIEEIRDYCITKIGVTESFPFDEVTLVFKVGGKIFALINLDSDPLRINLKCEPEKAIHLREKFSSVIPGYHMNKKHWNTVILDGSFPIDLLLTWINESYGLVFNSLPQKVKNELNVKKQ